MIRVVDALIKKPSKAGIVKLWKYYQSSDYSEMTSIIATGDFDNLQMGFDVDWIHHNGRTNIALFVDEWAPFTTFDKENHHNWFGFQFGHSQLFSLFNEEFYLRFENAILAPQLYEHKFPINKSFNQGYSIGYWSKGDSFDLWIVTHF